MAPVREVIAKAFAEATIEGLWPWVASFVGVSVMTGYWHYLATEQPGWAVVIGFLVLGLIVKLLTSIARCRRYFRSHDDRGCGIEFSANRDELNKRRTLQQQLGQAHKISAILVVGQNFAISDIPELGNIKRLILPDPQSTSLASFAQSPNESIETMRTQIIQAKTEAKARFGVEVRYHPHFLHCSMMIGDADRNDGWVHIEYVFPGSHYNRRPAITIYRKDCEEVVIEAAKIFEFVWDNSTPQ